MFTERLETIIFEQNHIFKYKGPLQILSILNYICMFYNEEYETTLSFALTDDQRLRIESDNIEYEICMLPKILDQFKKCYRCREKCHEQ